MDRLTLTTSTAALVLIDLQQGVVAMSTAPYSAPEVVAKGRALAEAFRAKGGTVVYVRVDLADFLQLPVDTPSRPPGAPAPPPAASELSPDAGYSPGDLLITKRHWGAFAGTTLEAELRSRGIETIVLGGIATNFGVESTARQGTGLGFAFVIVEDACTSRDAAAHRFAFDEIFPRLARVRSSAEVIDALG
jgi:nicotinamidase-related amidase